MISDFISTFSYELFESRRNEKNHMYAECGNASVLPIAANVKACKININNSVFYFYHHARPYVHLPTHHIGTIPSCWK